MIPHILIPGTCEYVMLYGREESGCRWDWGAKQMTLRWRDDLDYLGRHNVITRVIWTKEGDRRVSVRGMHPWGFNQPLLSLKMEASRSQPESWAAWGKGKEVTLPLELQNECSPAQHLELSPVRLILDFWLPKASCCLSVKSTVICHNSISETNALCPKVLIYNSKNLKKNLNAH